MPLKLRMAHPGDADVLTDILHRSKASWGYAEDRMTAFRSEYRIKPAMLATRSFLVAERGGRPVGFADGTGAGDSFNLEFLFVAPEEQRQGVGQLLLERMCDRTRELGKSRIVLESDAFAVDFYLQNNFTVLTERPSQMAPGLSIPFMERKINPYIQQLERVTLRHDPDLPWCFAEKCASAIRDHWEAQVRNIPQLWNGKTLKLARYTLSDGHLSGTCLETDYAAFLAWRDWGCPDFQAANLFGSAVIRSSDGAFLLGQMAASTANAGKIYPPGGNLDPGDVSPDGRVDMIGSIARELREETGLDAADAALGPLLFVDGGPLKSVARVLDFPHTVEDLCHAIRAHLRNSPEEELADIVVLRTVEDMEGLNIVPYARSLMRYLL